jgi:hypothetical protein
VQGVSGQHGIDGRVRQRYRLSATGRARTAGSAWRSSTGIAGSGSTATTSVPSATSVPVSLPVPAPVKLPPARREFQRPTDPSQRVVRAVLGIFDRRRTKRRAEP